MEYALNTMNVISQSVVPVANGLQDGLSQALGQVTGSVHRVIYDAWPTAGTGGGGVPAVYMIAGAMLFAVGYFTLRRA